MKVILFPNKLSRRNVNSNKLFMSKKLWGVLFFLVFIRCISLGQTVQPQFRNDLAKAKTDSQLLQVYKKIYEYYKHANNDSAKALLEQGIKTFDAHNFTYGKASILIMQSGIYEEEGVPSVAMQKEKEGLKLFTELNDKKDIANANNTIGVSEMMRGNYDVAINYFLAALNYYDRVSDTPGTINTYIRLGAANDYSSNNDKALEYYQKALALSLHTKVYGNTIYAYNNIGISYAKRSKFDTALIYFEKALVLSENPDFAKIRLQPLTNIGKIYAEKKDNKRALEYFYRGLSLARKLKMQENIGRLLYEIGMIEGLHKPYNMESLQQALNIAKTIDNKNLQDEILSGMAKVADSNHNYKDEVNYLKQEWVIHDSLYSIAKAKQIANLQSEYDLNKSNKELATLQLSEHRNLQKKNLIIAISLILAITLLTLLFFYIKSTKLNKELSAREKDLKKANDVKDRLFSIIGHDLKGPIGNIPNLLNIHNHPTTTSEEKKYILDSLEENTLASLETLEKLLSWGKLQLKGNVLNKTAFSVEHLMNHILRLLAVSYSSKNITIINNIPANIQLYADENHFKFVIRNLLSNAIKYTRINGIIEVNAERIPNDKFITFSVKDNGVGIPADRLEHIFEPYNESTRGTANELGNSIGLMLCREFILQNGGTIWVKSEKDLGTTFYFNIMRAN